MRPGSKWAEAGFTYLLLLWWVAISSFVTAALATQWQIEAAREREVELVFRASQIQAALAAYRCNTPDGHVAYPKQLHELLEDVRGAQPRHHLRRLWPDPVTGREWGLLRQLEGGGITGVYSTARGTPWRSPPGVESYPAWQFEAGSTPCASEPGR